MVGMAYEPEPDAEPAPVSAPGPVLVKPWKKHVRILVPAEELFCLVHARKKPCERCEEEYERGRRICNSSFGYALNQARGGRDAILSNLEPARPTELPAVSLDDFKADFSYDAEKYRKEINKALSYAMELLRSFPNWKDSGDLVQTVDFELYKACKHYGDKMNNALAYSIAKNQARKFLKQQIVEQKVTAEGGFGNVEKDEFGRDKTVNRWCSFGDRGKDEESEPAEISSAEKTVSQEDQDAAQAREKEQEFGEEVAQRLIRLVASWHGVKRLVGESLLADPETTVRDIPGVPKSTAGRLRKVILNEFRLAAETLLK